VTIAAKPRQSLRLRGRSFLALVLQPEPPLGDWIADLDEWLRRSPGFFLGRPVVLDVSAMSLNKEELASLIAELNKRDVRLMGVEGTKSSYLDVGMPPLISGGRESEAEIPSIPPASAAQAPKGAAAASEVEAPAPAAATERARSLLVDSAVRSGQSVIFPHGDVTIIGSVASGAEIVAGGSIHVYGALRGRAIAGANGNAQARIFCGKLEAELLAIDGLYKTADDMEPEIRGRRVQTWLDGNIVRMTALN
jgi:septum site-determining protein MinC